LWLGLASVAVAAVVGLLAWMSRDRSARLAAPRSQPPS
jgi:hypothetical protein